MKVLVLGANGATGFNVVTQLLKQGIDVKALTRNVEKFDSIKRRKGNEIRWLVVQCCIVEQMIIATSKIDKKTAIGFEKMKNNMNTKFLEVHNQLDEIKSLIQK